MVPERQEERSAKQCEGVWCRGVMVWGYAILVDCTWRTTWAWWDRLAGSAMALRHARTQLLPWLSPRQRAWPAWLLLLPASVRTVD